MKTSHVRRHEAKERVHTRAHVIDPINNLILSKCGCGWQLPVHLKDYPGTKAWDEVHRLFRVHMNEDLQPVSVP